ncbi:MAG: glycosyltransferase [Dongiaceae bacterium]
MADLNRAGPDAIGRKLRVLHVITGLDAGGAEGMLSALLTGRHAPDLEQAVVSLTPGGCHAERLCAAGVAVTELAMRRARPSPGELLGLARRIRAWRPDVVQGWMYHADLAALAALALSGRRPATRLVWGLRCSDLDLGRYGPSLRLTVRACAALSGRPDAVVANSQAGLAAHLRIGYRPRRADVIHNGIDTGVFAPDPAARAAVRRTLGIDPAAPLVAHVARVDPMKDHAGFLAALAGLPGVQALAIGVGTDRLPPAAGLHRLGRRDDVSRLLTAADLVISSSAFGEGFSNALAEGMAAGLPAAATDVGDARLIVGDTGVVVPPGEPAALAAAIGALLGEDPVKRRARAEGARARIVENFPLARAARRFAELNRAHAGPETRR